MATRIRGRLVRRVHSRHRVGSSERSSCIEERERVGGARVSDSAVGNRSDAQNDASRAIEDEQRRSTRVVASIEREQARTTTTTTESSDGSYDTPAPLVQTRANITAIADLFGVFDGKSSHYETLEKQIKLLKSTYRLEDDVAKILVGMRLKRRAHEWLHSKSEHIGMTFDRFLDGLRAMFFRPQSKVETRRKFEERVWKRDETFQKYFHEKIIMGNRVPIDEDEILEYVIEGIPDETLRDQARIQRFATADRLLEAFERVTL